MTRKKTLLAVAFIIFVMVFVGLTYLDVYLAGVLKATLERETLLRTGLQLDLGGVEVNALRGDLLALAPRVIDPERAQTLALAQRLTIDANPWSLFGDVARINRISLWKLETSLEIGEAGLGKIAEFSARSIPSAHPPGLRIDTISVNAEELVVSHQLPGDRTVNWKIQPADITTESIRWPPAPGAQIHTNLSARLLEPSTGTLEAQFVCTRTETGWDVSGWEDARIARIAALSPYLPADFPLVVSSGSLALRNDMALHGTVLETTVTVNVKDTVVGYEIRQGERVDWKIQTADGSVEGVRLPPIPGSRIRMSLSARLLEPSTGTLEAQFVFERTENDWQVSGWKDVRIARVAALNPSLPPDFPFVASAGSLTLRNDMALHGTILESTVTLTLSKPRFKAREKRISALFAGQMSQFAIRAIRDATGDINLDPIYVHGDLSDPQVDLGGQFVTDLRRQILSRVFHSATSIPADMAKQLQETILSLPPAFVLDGAERVAGKVLETGAGLAKKTKEVGETATDAAKGVGSFIKGVFKKKK